MESNQDELLANLGQVLAEADPVPAGVIDAAKEVGRTLLIGVDLAGLTPDGGQIVTKPLNRPSQVRDSETFTPFKQPATLPPSSASAAELMVD